MTGPTWFALRFSTADYYYDYYLALIRETILAYAFWLAAILLSTVDFR